MSSADDGLVLALDCGTSSIKALVLDRNGHVHRQSAVPIGLRTPAPGWVEQDPQEIVACIHQLAQQLAGDGHGSPIAAVGVSNQRESVMAWDRRTGEPMSPLISWQDRRGTELARHLAADGHCDVVRRISGLPLDPMFSAVKVTWLLNDIDPNRSKSTAGKIAVGTVDSWIIWHLTGEHATEPGNASRTSLMDIESGTWSEQLLEIFNVPADCLPIIGYSARPDLRILHGPLHGLPLSGLAGDSHASLFAHAGWKGGVVKATVGTGSSVMATVDESVDSLDLCRTVAWHLPNEAVTHALEANILSAGATLVWLANILQTTPEELAAHALIESDTVFVPAFDGLGAPWWDDQAVALVSDLSLSTTRSDLASAALDSVAMQVADVLEALDSAGVSVQTLIVDGGMTVNSFVNEALANASGVSINVPQTREASAVGAGQLAGIGAGLWTKEDLDAVQRDYVGVIPSIDDEKRIRRRHNWNQAVNRARLSGYDRRGHE